MLFFVSIFTGYNPLKNGISAQIVTYPWLVCSWCFQILKGQILSYCNSISLFVVRRTLILRGFELTRRRIEFYIYWFHFTTFFLSTLGILNIETFRLSSQLHRLIGLENTRQYYALILVSMFVRPIGELGEWTCSDLFGSIAQSELILIVGFVGKMVQGLLYFIIHLWFYIIRKVWANICIHIHQVILILKSRSV